MEPSTTRTVVRARPEGTQLWWRLLRLFFASDVPGARNEYTPASMLNQVITAVTFLSFAILCLPAVRSSLQRCLAAAGRRMEKKGRCLAAAAFREQMEKDRDVEEAQDDVAEAQHEVDEEGTEATKQNDGETPERDSWLASELASQPAS